MSGLNLEAYFQARPDVVNYIRSIRADNRDSHWREGANKMYGKNASSLAEFTEDELGRYHYQNWGRNEGTVGSELYRNIENRLSDFQKRVGAIRGDLSNVDEATRKETIKENFEREYTPSSFDMGEFEGLLGRLEGSKMRQQRQKSVEGRRDIMAGGQAGMMNNF